MDFLFALAGFFCLILLGFFVGKALEKRHFLSLQEREAKLQHILLSANRQPPPHFSGQPFRLVSGSVVISGDYFKIFVAGLKSLIGGRLPSYETLLERGRREAIIRMKEEAAQYGAQAIFNVRLETSTLNQNKQKNSIICAELLAYGTAFKAAPRETAANVPK
jgi:uncharacterized protein YbjQ (UPF0145 family)